MAANLTIPTSIIDGQALSAAPVKGNFDAVATWVNTNTVQLDGSKPMTGELVGTGADPTSANQYARKAYVDAIITGTGIITATQLGTGAVTSTKILDDTILNADINSAAGIALTKLATGTVATVVMHNGSGVPTATAVSGDITIGATGVAAIGTGVIVDADIAAGAAITKAKLSTTAGELGGAWVSQAITFTNITGGAGTCFIMLMGKTLHFRLEMTAGTVTAGGLVTISLTGVTFKTGTVQPISAYGLVFSVSQIAKANANGGTSGLVFARDGVGANWTAADTVTGIKANGVVEID